jgi:hypothetical protein
MMRSSPRRVSNVEGWTDREIGLIARTGGLGPDPACAFRQHERPSLSMQPLSQMYFQEAIKDVQEIESG